MAIYVTGDTHGDISRLGSKSFPIGKNLDRDDYVIIAGDFGVVWSNDKNQKYWLKWLSEKPFTICFIDGNHENFDILNSYDVKYWNGGKVHQIGENVFHLMRGQVFNLNNVKIFTFGGADSDDKIWRTLGKSYWKDEMPNHEEFEEGVDNLIKHEWRVDYIVTHTAPTHLLALLNEHRPVPRLSDDLTQYLEKISLKVNFKKWVHGHFHLNMESKEKYRCIYRDIIRLEGKNECEKIL